MKLLHAFLRRSLADQLQLIQAVSLVLVVRVALSLFKFQTVRRILAYLIPPAATQQPNTAAINRVIWAVDAASNRLLPAGPCLTKALVAQALLSRQGYSTTLRIGVQRLGKQLAAHAWLEHQGQIVIGQIQNLMAFTPLPPLDAEAL